MATSSASPRAPRPLRRDRAGGMLGGVAAGLARHLGIDPLLIRIGFVVLTLAGGLGIAAYLLAWVAIPAGEGGRRAEVFPGRGSVEVALGVALLLVSALLAFRALGVWLSDAVVWPVVLVAAGAALLWRQSAAAAPTAAPVPVEEPARPRRVRERAGIVSRTGLGAALVVAAGITFLAATGALSAARDVVLAVLVVAVVLGVIFAPWIVRLVRSLSAERSERIRSQERAELAAHLHDSVLQTLALVQKQADDPRQVASLARRQERELRAWLSGRPQPGAAVAGVAAALEQAADEVERAHGVPIEVVAVGDRPLDPAAEALVAAAREAMVNAAKFAGGAAIDVYAEASPERVQAFVRDRGPGFDPAQVPADRRGLRESIVGRMRRHGGRARVTSAPETGTEVELVVEEGGS